MSTDNTLYPWVFGQVPAPDSRYLPGWYAERDAYFQNDFIYVGPRLREEFLHVQLSLYGIPIPITAGVRRMTGNAVYCAKLTEVESHYHDGGENEHSAFYYTYFADWMVSFGIADPSLVDKKVLRMWANGNLIVDRTGQGKVLPIGAKLAYPDGSDKPPTLVPTDAEVTYKFYPGTETQEPDPTILKREDVDTWTAYRGQMCVMFTDFPLQWFNNSLPAITVEIGDSTSLRTQTYVMAASPQPDGSMLAVDWTGGFAYANNPGPLYQYSLDDNVLLSKADLDFARMDGSAIIPWTGNLITSDLAGNIYQRVSIVEPTSGTTLFDLGTNTDSAGSGIIKQLHHVIPVRVPTPLVPIDAYVFCSQFRDLQIVIADPETGELKYVWHDDTLVDLISTGNLRCGAPGADLTNGKVVYIGVGDVGAVAHKGVWRMVLDGSLQQSKPSQPGGVTGSPQDSETPWYAPPNDYSPRGLVYDAGSNALLVMLDKPGSGDPARMASVDATTGVERWNLEMPYKLSCVDGANFWQSNALPGFLATVLDGSPPKIMEIDTSNGEYTTYAATDDDGHGGHGSTPSLVAAIGDAGSQSLVGFDAGGDAKRVYYNRLNDSRTTLKHFLEFAATQAGLIVPDDFTVDDTVDDMIDGGMIMQPVKFSQFLSNLAVIYRFDIVEHGTQIVIIRKDAADGHDFDFAASDLIELAEGAPATVVIRRETGVDLPYAVQLSFLDKAQNFNPNFVFAQRSGFPVATSHSTDPILLGMPLIITATEATRLANLLLYRIAATQNSQAWRTGPVSIRVEPGDVGTVSDGELQYIVKVIKTTINADLSVLFNAQSYQSDAPIGIVAEDPPPWEPPIFGFVRTEVIPIDCGLIAPADDVATFGNDDFTLYYVIAPTSRRAYRGGTAQFGLSPSSYNVLGTSVAAPCIGRLSAVLGNVASPWVTDTTHTLQVQLVSDTADQLVTITDIEFLGSGNLALVGRDNDWEVVQFRDVADLGNNKFALTTLLRGRKGTEDFTGGHKVGDYFILIDSLTQIQALPSIDLGKRLFYRGVSINQQPRNGLIKTIVPEGNSAMPLRPCHGSAVISGSDLVVHWARRTRGDGRWRDGTGDVSIFEIVDIFDVTFYADDTFTAGLGVTTSDKDTGEGTSDSETCTLTPARQTALLGGAVTAGDTLYVGITQRGSVASVFGRTLYETLVIA